MPSSLDTYMLAPPPLANYSTILSEMGGQYLGNIGGYAGMAVGQFVLDPYFTRQQQFRYSEGITRSDIQSATRYLALHTQAQRMQAQQASRMLRGFTPQQFHGTIDQGVQMMSAMGMLGQLPGMRSTASYLGLGLIGNKRINPSTQTFRENNEAFDAYYGYNSDNPLKMVTGDTRKTSFWGREEISEAIALNASLNPRVPSNYDMNKAYKEAAELGVETLLNSDIAGSELLEAEKQSAMEEFKRVYAITNDIQGATQEAIKALPKAKQQAYLDKEYQDAATNSNGIDNNLTHILRRDKVEGADEIVQALKEGGLDAASGMARLGLTGQANKDVQSLLDAKTLLNASGFQGSLTDFASTVEEAFGASAVNPDRLRGIAMKVKAASKELDMTVEEVMGFMSSANDAAGVTRNREKIGDQAVAALAAGKELGLRGSELEAYAINSIANAVDNSESLLADSLTATTGLLNIEEKKGANANPEKIKVLKQLTADLTNPETALQTFNAIAGGAYSEVSPILTDVAQGLSDNDLKFLDARLTDEQRLSIQESNRKQTETKYLKALDVNYSLAPTGNEEEDKRRAQTKAFMRDNDFMSAMYDYTKDSTGAQTVKRVSRLADKMNITTGEVEEMLMIASKTAEDNGIDLISMLSLGSEHTQKRKDSLKEYYNNSAAEQTLLSNRQKFVRELGEGSGFSIETLGSLITNGVNINDPEVQNAMTTLSEAVRSGAVSPEDLAQLSKDFDPDNTEPINTSKESAAGRFGKFMESKGGITDNMKAILNHVGNALEVVQEEKQNIQGEVLAREGVNGTAANATQQKMELTGTIKLDMGGNMYQGVATFLGFNRSPSEGNNAGAAQ